MTIHTALLQGRKLLEQAGIDAPRLTAEVLLAYATGHDRVWLVAHSKDELREVWWIHFGRYLHERMQGRPTQYITKHQEFYGRDFRVTPSVLIPRPETEHLIEAVIQLQVTSRQTILDIGTGSGAIAVTLALETSANVVACDISSAALDIAVENGRWLQSSVQWVLSDLASAFAAESFDIVASNPPYVAQRDKATLQREVRDFEPELALYGGEDGLDIYRRLIPDAWRVLKPGGWLVMEIGASQADAVQTLLASGNQWIDVSVRVDLAGLPRIALARRV
ncbi:MAG: peptide chain release factor N(5)-glutamine methyltransferase [Acidobacteriota bacterium]